MALRARHRLFFFSPPVNILFFYSLTHIPDLIVACVVHDVIAIIVGAGLNGIMHARGGFAIGDAVDRRYAFEHAGHATSQRLTVSVDDAIKLVGHGAPVCAGAIVAGRNAAGSDRCDARLQSAPNGIVKARGKIGRRGIDALNGKAPTATRGQTRNFDASRLAHALNRPQEVERRDRRSDNAKGV